MGRFKEFDGLQIPDRVQDKKFTLGEKTDDFQRVKHLNPVFAFDFISLNRGDFCFDGKLLGRDDYVKLMKSLKSISSYTYEMLDKEYRFHFHEIDREDVTISKSDFYKCISKNCKGEENIDAYQFKVYEEARIIGFLYMGVFYLVMFDRGHNAYKRK